MRDPFHAMRGLDCTLTDQHGLFPAFVHREEYLSLWTVNDRGSSLQSHPHESLAPVSEQVKCSFDQKCMSYANFLTLNSLIWPNFEFPKTHLDIRESPGRKTASCFPSGEVTTTKAVFGAFLCLSWSRRHCWGGINKFMYFFNFGEMVDESRGTLSRPPWLKANRFL